MKWVVVAACACVVGEAAAQPSAPSTRPPDAAKVYEAKRLFAEGRVLVEQGRADDACALFTESYQLDPAPGTALNLGECEERAEHWRRAFELYGTAATTFEEAQDVVRARFARDRADQVVAAHPDAAAPVVTPPPPPPAEHTSSSRTGVKIIAVGTLAVAAFASGFAVYSYGQIRDYERGPPAIGLDGRALGSADCGSASISFGEARASWDTACTATTRTKILVPLAVVSTVVGVGTLLYLVASKPKRGTLAVVPTVSPGAAAVTAVLEW